MKIIKARIPLLIAFILSYSSYAMCQTNDSLLFRASYLNTVLTDKRGNYAENGGWKPAGYIVDLTDTTNIVIRKVPQESYKIKRDTAYYDDFKDWWIDYKCVDLGNNVGHLRLEIYNTDRPEIWDNITLIGCLYIDYPSITYAYKLIPIK